MTRWHVVTPKYSYTEIIDRELGGPTFDICDVIEIEAETKRDAVALGVKVMLSDRRHYSYCLDQRSGGLCPYAGVWAEAS